VQHRTIPDAVPDGGVRNVQNGSQFLSREMPDEAGICFLYRYGENAPNLVQSRRHPILDEPHEGLDRREASVSRPSAVHAGCFEVI
jgi:hypothetical protein